MPIILRIYTYMYIGNGFIQEIFTSRHIILSFTMYLEPDGYCTCTCTCTLYNVYHCVHVIVCATCTVGCDINTYARNVLPNVNTYTSAMQGICGASLSDVVVIQKADIS